MFTLDDIKKVTHRPQARFDFILNPLTLRIVWVFVNFTNFNPNFISILSFVFFIASALFFLKSFFLLGSLCYLIRYILDRVDGKMARLKNKTSKMGMCLDNYTGYIGTVMCTIALIYPLNKTIIMFLIPLLVIMSVIHPLQGIIVMLFLKQREVRNYQEFLSFEDTRTITFVFLPLLPYIIQIKTISLLPVLILTILLFIAKQIGWFVYYYKEFKDYVEKKVDEVIH